MGRRFEDRTEAGEALATRLAEMSLTDPVILALPRGGLPVALPIARALGAPLDLLMVRKIGMPGHSELAAGAVVDGDAPQTVFNETLLKQTGLSESDFDQVVRDKLAEIDARRARYLSGRAPIPVEGRSAIVVDDGIATGATMRAAIRGLRRRIPLEIILAVPVAPDDSIADFRELVDRTICLECPRPFYAVGAHYRRFDQVSDDQVVAMMAEANQETREEGRE